MLLYFIGTKLIPKYVADTDAFRNRRKMPNWYSKFKRERNKLLPSVSEEDNQSNKS